MFTNHIYLKTSIAESLSEIPQHMKINEIQFTSDDNQYSSGPKFEIRNERVEMKRRSRTMDPQPSIVGHCCFFCKIIVETTSLRPLWTIDKN